MKIELQVERLYITKESNLIVEVFQKTLSLDGCRWITDHRVPQHVTKEVWTQAKQNISFSNVGIMLTYRNISELIVMLYNMSLLCEWSIKKTSMSINYRHKLFANIWETQSLWFKIIGKKQHGISEVCSISNRVYNVHCA